MIGNEKFWIKDRHTWINYRKITFLDVLLGNDKIEFSFFFKFKVRSTEKYWDFEPYLDQ